jgi:hypothetical protein
LRFEDKPDYSYLKRLFRDLFIREGMPPKISNVENVFSMFCCKFLGFVCKFGGEEKEALEGEK